MHRLFVNFSFASDRAREGGRISSLGLGSPSERLIRRGGAYTPEEQQGILDYCSADERDLQLLLPILLPQMDLDQQLLLGGFTRVLAWMEFNGIPVDLKMCNRLWRAWPKILLGLVRRCEAENNYNVFRFDKKGAHLDEKLYVELIVREGLRDEWPQSKTGKYSKSISEKKTEQPNLRTMANKYPRFRALFEVIELRQNYRVLRAAHRAGWPLACAERAVETEDRPRDA